MVGGTQRRRQRETCSVAFWVVCTTSTTSPDHQFQAKSIVDMGRLASRVRLPAAPSSVLSFIAVDDVAAGASIPPTTKVLFPQLPLFPPFPIRPVPSVPLLNPSLHLETS